MSDIKPQIQEAQRIPNKIKMNAKTNKQKYMQSYHFQIIGKDKEKC